ncbi:uncharacterized protein MONBRDRAFT_12439 [Monosiga brevicollis MX1]|uniref:Uncharacterized protein n=1 Tax=Monosiga brevicollis TaxID=81824 RepID=A9VC99_MONBE|nr:uncharacterized protein MONBRDRAFT_12439 [Monosiga brevicollis MX1]EDQ84823.1 predicted protein [Monosiga brevicollis MX1]|eukprot:XP_001750324.1 hypothetical protein [Monosiga brevicollis MX1]
MAEEAPTTPGTDLALTARLGGHGGDEGLEVRCGSPEPATPRKSAMARATIPPRPTARPRLPSAALVGTRVGIGVQSENYTPWPAARRLEHLFAEFCISDGNPFPAVLPLLRFHFASRASVASLSLPAWRHPLALQAASCLPTHLADLADYRRIHDIVAFRLQPLRYSACRQQAKRFLGAHRALGLDLDLLVDHLYEASGPPASPLLEPAAMTIVPTDRTDVQLLVHARDAWDHQLSVTPVQSWLLGMGDLDTSAAITRARPSPHDGASVALVFDDGVRLWQPARVGDSDDVVLDRIVDNSFSPCTTRLLPDEGGLAMQTDGRPVDAVWSAHPRQLLILQERALTFADLRQPPRRRPGVVLDWMGPNERFVATAGQSNVGQSVFAAASTSHLYLFDVRWCREPLLCAGHDHDSNLAVTPAWTDDGSTSDLDACMLSSSAGRSAFMWDQLHVAASYGNEPARCLQWRAAAANVATLDTAAPDCRPDFYDDVLGQTLGSACRLMRPKGRYGSDCLEMAVFDLSATGFLFASRFLHGDNTAHHQYRRSSTKAVPVDGDDIALDSPQATPTRSRESRAAEAPWPVRMWRRLNNELIAARLDVRRAGIPTAAEPAAQQPVEDCTKLFKYSVGGAFSREREVVRLEAATHVLQQGYATSNQGANHVPSSDAPVVTAASEPEKAFSPHLQSLATRLPPVATPRDLTSLAAMSDIEELLDALPEHVSRPSAAAAAIDEVQLIKTSRLPALLSVGREARVQDLDAFAVVSEDLGTDELGTEHAPARHPELSDRARALLSHFILDDDSPPVAHQAPVIAPSPVAAGSRHSRRHIGRRPPLAASSLGSVAQTATPVASEALIDMAHGLSGSQEVVVQPTRAVLGSQKRSVRTATRRRKRAKVGGFG